MLLFKLLIGSYPFGTKISAATKERIIEDKLNYDSLLISAEGQDLLKQLLVKDPLKRIALNDIRKHTWITKECRVFAKPSEITKVE